MVEINSDSEDLKGACDRLVDYVGRPAGFLSQIGKYQVQRFKSSFDANQAPTGENWTPLAASTLASKRNRKLLVESAGRIPGSLYSLVNGDSLEVGYNHPLAVIHHSGFKGRRVPQRQQALFSAGVVRPNKKGMKGGGQGRSLPPRPLIGYTDTDVQEWQELLEEGAGEAWNDV